jgi:hypothetical protein
MSTNDKVGTTISGGGGVNLISADAFVEIPLAENLELISARRSITDVINTPTFSNYYQRSQTISANSADKSTNSLFL